MHTKLLCILVHLVVFLASRSSLRAEADPAWNFPENTAPYGQWVPCALDVSTEVAPRNSRADIFSGTTQIGTIHSTSVKQGIRRFSGFLYFNASGQKDLSAKITDGFTSTTIQGPTITVVSPAPEPTFFPEPVTDATAISLIVNASIEPHGTLVPPQSRIRVTPVYWSNPATRPDVYWEYGTTPAYGSFQYANLVRDGEVYYGEFEANERYHYRGRFEFLLPNTTYHYRIVMNGVPGPDQVMATTPNNVPVARDDIAVVGKDGSVEVRVIANDWDEGVNLDTQGLRTTLITSVSASAHGTVQIHESGLYLRYTAGEGFEDHDEFTYTIRDPFGGEGTAKVTVLSIDAHFESIQGHYSTNGIYYGRGSGELAATLKVSVTKSGHYSGALTYFGARYGFSGAFPRNGESFVNFEIPREGRLPINLNIGVSRLNSFEDSSGPVVFGDLYDEPEGVGFEFDFTPANVGPNDPIVEAGAYPVLLPNPEAAVGETVTASVPKLLELDTNGTPQGHGFAALKTNMRGSSRIVGRTGDNRPFSVGTKLRKDRKILLGARTGIGRRGGMFGLISFDAAACAGTLRWTGPAGTSGAYQAGFGFALNAAGTKAEQSSTAEKQTRIIIRDHAGAVLAQETGILKSNNRLDTGSGKSTRIRISVNKKTGAFRGTLTRAGKPAIQFSGMLRADKQRGLGVAGDTGFDGPVELIAL